MSKILDADWGHSPASQEPGRETSKQMRCRQEIALERLLTLGDHGGSGRSVPDSNNSSSGFWDRFALYLAMRESLRSEW